MAREPLLTPGIIDEVLFEPPIMEPDPEKPAATWAASVWSTCFAAVAPYDTDMPAIPAVISAASYCPVKSLVCLDTSACDFAPGWFSDSDFSTKFPVASPIAPATASFSIPVYATSSPAALLAISEVTYVPIFFRLNISDRVF